MLSPLRPVNVDSMPRFPGFVADANWAVEYRQAGIGVAKILAIEFGNLNQICHKNQKGGVTELYTFGPICT